MAKLGNVELINHIVEAIIEVIGRRSSERYAVVVINNVIIEMQQQYDFFKQITVTSSQYVETGDTIKVETKINKIEPDLFAEGMKTFLAELVVSAGKTAGYYFIKELKETMKTADVTALEKKGIDLDFLQLRQAVSRKEPTEEEDSSTVGMLKHLISTIFLILDAELNRERALILLTETFDDLGELYPVLEYITIHDIRFTQADESIWIAPDINNYSEKEISQAIQALLLKINNLKDYKIIHFKEKLFNRLRPRDQVFFENMGVDFSELEISNALVFKQVMHAILDVLGKASTPSYAVLFMDTILKKVDDKFEFLRFVKIDPTRYSQGAGAITVMTNFDDLTSIQTGRAIQKIMEEIVKTLVGEARLHFVEEFKKSVESSLLKQIEEDMGVNLHIVQLRQNFTNPEV